MITVRASTLDSFGLYMDPDVNFISTEEMDARIARGAADGGSTSEAAALGTAFHEAVAGTYVGAILFDPATITKARRGLGGVPSEVYGSTIVDVDGTPVRLTGHADYLLGLKLLDFKTSRKPIPPDRHADSLQWRAYCVIFGAECVTYRHVQLDDDDDGVVYAKSIDDVVMYPYPKLRDDVVQALRALLEYARTRGILESMDDSAA
ncbi:MAG TPA: hypothetical protein VJP45_10380 [Candidatus Limnocylindria bacterium]|nr:hypothetical protein [Candidatus Limnocylindria bacterium]